MAAETRTETGRPVTREYRGEPGEPVDVKTWGIFAHLSTLTYLLGGILAFLGPLVVWLIGKDRSSTVDLHGREALNFGITVSIFAAAIMVVGALATVTLGPLGSLVFLLWIALFVFWLVFMIMGTVKAGQGVVYHYPVAFPFMRERGQEMRRGPVPGGT